MKRLIVGAAGALLAVGVTLAAVPPTPTASAQLSVLVAGPVAYPAAAHVSHHFKPNLPARPKRKAAAPARAPAMHGPVVASYYDLSGTGACGAPAQSGYQFASLILPCGARIVICNGSRCVTATMDDHGPYVYGRTFDLNVNLKNALGCGGLCYVTWRPA